MYAVLYVASIWFLSLICLIYVFFITIILSSLGIVDASDIGYFALRKITAAYLILPLKLI